MASSPSFAAAVCSSGKLQGITMPGFATAAVPDIRPREAVIGYLPAGNNGCPECSTAASQLHIDAGDLIATFLLSTALKPTHDL